MEASKCTSTVNTHKETLVRDISSYFIFITKPIIMVYVDEFYIYTFWLYPDGINMHTCMIQEF